MIYLFSGTGNTRMVAHALAEALGEDITEFTAQQLRRPDNVILRTDNKRIIWAFPTYSWGMPPVISAIIAEAELQIPADAIHYAVTTCGDDVGNLPEAWRKAIRRRGLEPGSVFSVQMPNTYVMMKGFDVDSDKITNDKLAAMPARVAEVANSINAGSLKDNDVVRGSFGAIKTGLVYPWFTHFRMKPSGYRVRSEACVSCAACVRACPMENVQLDAGGHPVWGDNCAFCTACYHACPQHAVEWRNTTLTKGRKKIF